VVEDLLGPMGVTHGLYLVRLTQASLFFDEGDVVKARRALEEAFRMGRAKGYWMTLAMWWQREEMARLCAEALMAGIGADYATELITTHGLEVPEGYEAIREWQIGRASCRERVCQYV
jgi:hypothetical protein